MSLLVRLADVLSARSALRRSAAMAASAAADRAASSTTAARNCSSSIPIAWQQQQQRQAEQRPTQQRYYSPPPPPLAYASPAAAAAAAAAAAGAAPPPPPTPRPAPPPPGQTPQNAPAPPWTPTRLLAKRKRPQKRMRALIQHLEREHAERAAALKQHPLPGAAAGGAGAGGAGAGGGGGGSRGRARAGAAGLRAGQVLEVRCVVPEAGRKVYTYRGVCLGAASKGPRSWLKMYNVFPDAGGVVQHLPIYMPDLLSVKVVGRLPRARRARLYHLLDDESTSMTFQNQVGASEPAP